MIGRLIRAAILVALLVLACAALHIKPKDDPCRRADGTFDSEVCDGPDEK